MGVRTLNEENLKTHARLLKPKEEHPPRSKAKRNLQECPGFEGAGFRFGFDSSRSVDHLLDSKYSLA